MIGIDFGEKLNTKSHQAKFIKIHLMDFKAICHSNV
jgi:hypothetical protein